MSPASYGYFVNATTHQVILIRDHAKDACANPNQLGLDDLDFEDVDPVQQRIEVLRRVLSNGWLRVRHRGAEASVEHIADWIDVLEAIAETTHEVRLGEWTYLVFRNVDTRQELCLYVRDLLIAIRGNEIEELISNIR